MTMKQGSDLLITSILSPVKNNHWLNILFLFLDIIPNPPSFLSCQFKVHDVFCAQIGRLLYITSQIQEFFIVFIKSDTLSCFDKGGGYCHALWNWRKCCQTLPSRQLHTILLKGEGCYSDHSAESQEVIHCCYM